MPYFYDAELRNKRTVLVRGKKIIYTDAMTDCKKVFEFSIKELRLDKKAEEYAFMLAYDTKKSLIGVFEISHGTINTALLSNREIFMRALLIGAANIIIVHNHPSGNILPSGQDRDVCKRIMNAAKLLEIPLDDFIIIGSGEYYSFRKENELL